MQKSHGFTYDEHGLIFQNESRTWMKPMSIWTYDSMHCLFANGILGAEVDATMALLNTRGLTYEVLRQLLPQVIISKAISQPAACVLHCPLAEKRLVTVDGEASLRKDCWFVLFAPCWFPSIPLKG
jgi:hypothetical protein